MAAGHFFTEESLKLEQTRSESAAVLKISLIFVQRCKELLGKENMLFTDKHDMGDESMMMLEYAGTIYKNMRQHEMQSVIDPNYLSNVQVPTGVGENCKLNERQTRHSVLNLNFD